MVYALLALKGPSNIERKVRELQRTLYRQGGLVSALALPVVIPLCFVAPGAVPTKRGELRDRLRRSVGREAPYLTSRSVAESDGCLFWDLAPRRELQRLQRSCQKVFTPPDAQQGARQPDLFPVARGFFLCSLQGSSPATVPSLTVPESLLFPAKAAILMNVHPLGVESAATGQSASSTVNQPWWTSLFWEKLEEIPLRKTRAAD